MSLRIPKGEKPGPGLHAALTDLAWQARRDVERIDSDTERRTHAIRTGMKKFRALLRLAKPAVEREERRDLRRLISEIKGGLSTARDRVVIAGVAKSVLGRDADPTAEASTPPMEIGALSEVAKSLAARTSALNLAGLGSGTLRKRWKRTRRRARDAGKQARKSGAAEDFHCWRKRVKDLWYQSDALAALSEDAVTLVKSAKKLSGILGKEHDLTVAIGSLDDLSKDDRDALEKQREKCRCRAFRVTRDL